MAQPAKKSAELITRFGQMLENREPIDEFTYRSVLKNFQYSTDPNDVCAVGFAYALNGEDDLAYQHFSKHIDLGSLTIATNFAAFLFKRFHYNKMNEVIFALSDRFGGRMLTVLAGTEAYRIGSIDLVEKHLTRHIAILNDGDDRDGARLYMKELVSGLNECYEAKVCTPAQLKCLGKLTNDILEKHKIVPGSVNIYPSYGGDYLVETQNIEPKKIVELNFELAELVCGLPEMDDCEMVARFTSQRVNVKGDTYDYKW
ncbi:MULTISPECIES: hypothetical protein [unclassified Serratia (in: enterobacteria)]|uniref:hypothetical protein n=1 Tax=unclassified Serratia (in: enterobacteria) TaxID=2647522 RepID=UPI000468BF62|nr:MULTISPECIES: hypothetical protein [unclassified Serratia (in: enterobacteria)]